MESFKKELILTYQALPKIEGLENNKLVIITAAGIFMGTPILSCDEKDDDIVKIASSLINGGAKDYRKKHNIPNDQPLDGNDGCFILSDVTLIAGNTRYTIPIVTIFFDQVIGISWGDIN